MTALLMKSFSTKIFPIIFLLFFFNTDKLCANGKCLSGNCWQGKGVYQFDNGARYVGDFRNGRYEGLGTYIYKNKTIHTGLYANGLPDGAGMMLTIDGWLTMGEWKEGKLQGKVIEITNANHLFMGEYQQGKRKGEGTFIYENGGIYVGEFDEGFNGQGTWYYTGGYKKGKWVNYVCEGCPEIASDEEKPFAWQTLTYADGDKYIGQVADGKPNGWGTYIHTSGNMHKGYFKDGYSSGLGIYMEPDLEYVFIGEFSAGKMQGAGTTVLAKDDSYDIYMGHFVDGLLNGIGYCTYADGESYYGGMKEFLRYGPGTYYLGTNERYEGTFEADKRQGPGISYYADGTSERKRFKNDILEWKESYDQPTQSDFSYSSSGQANYSLDQATREMLASAQQGGWKLFHVENGSTNMNAGLQFRSYFPNGTSVLIVTATEAAATQSGYKIFWSRNGEEIFSKQHKRGDYNGIPYATAQVKIDADDGTLYILGFPQSTYTYNTCLMVFTR